MSVATNVTAALAGATGLVGRACLDLLLDDGRYSKVVAVTRRPIGIRHPKLEERIVSFDALSRDALSGCDVAMCALGTTIRKAGSQPAFRLVDHDYVERFAEC